MDDVKGWHYFSSSGVTFIFLGQPDKQHCWSVYIGHLVISLSMENAAVYSPHGAHCVDVSGCDIVMV